jgi:hypothetical protein
MGTLFISLLAGSTLLLGCATAVDTGDDTAAVPDDAGGGSDTALRPGYDSSYLQPDASTSDPDGNVDTDASTGSSACSFSGVLAKFDFTGEPGSQASTVATSSAPGITAGSLSRSGTITAASGSNSMNGSGWPTSALDGTRYYTFTLTPGSCVLDITSVSIDTKASTTGPIDGAIATSDDGFATTSAFTPGSSTKVSLSVSGTSKAVEIRLYGYKASGSAGTMRIQNTMTVTGSLK